MMPKQSENKDLDYIAKLAAGMNGHTRTVTEAEQELAARQLEAVTSTADENDDDVAAAEDAEPTYTNAVDDPMAVFGIGEQLLGIDDDASISLLDLMKRIAKVYKAEGDGGSVRIMATGDGSVKNVDYDVASHTLTFIV
jgi:hypothetical protein